MDEYTPSTYGDRIAGVFDDWYQGRSFEKDPGSTVAFLAALAGKGPALELGIGTGRIALPLHEAGVEVHGIDASERMVERLRAKPGGDRIPVTIGSFADFSLKSRFHLVYVPFNTLWALSTQGEQVSCFRAAARHLRRDGTFVIEAWVPDVTRFSRGQNVSASHVDADSARLEVSIHDPLNQRVDSHHVLLREGQVEMYPVKVRYAYPSELDLMAQLAGMRLRERWSDWHAEPFTDSSPKHVSVYELAPA